ncbi:hypothetical protein [uncultured Brevundimonas sp.]|uniref:hypothetical protein n=1 Tax=uncultured Brevundimonas sp. TaxID=213418 RepID=UPI0030EF8ED4|tara:strand:- start:255336 stop:255920 length:585 start_codon:yes stop_codon:yes gene_type:complete
MKTFPRLALASPAVAGAMVLGLMAAGPADAQSRYRTYDQDRGRTQDSQTQGVLVGAAIGAVAGALLGNGDSTYVAGGALAGAAIGASAGSNDRCSYYRDNRCYRNQGHWEREHGINSRSGYGYTYDNGYGNAYGNAYGNTYGSGYGYGTTGTATRDRRDCSYYRDNRCYRNQGHWEREHGINSRDRNYRYDRRW